MKKVTSWAAIIAVPTLVTGYYGMNVPYPGEDEVWGVVTSSSLAVGGAAALYALFRRKEWL
jgi:magnesium transporter